MYYLLDTHALPHTPLSKSLSRLEMRKICPTGIPRYRNFIFKHRIPMKFENRDIVFALLEKFPSLIITDESGKPLPIRDDLDEMKHAQLFRTGALYRITDFSPPDDAVRDRIREARRQGVIPLTNEQLDQIRAEKHRKSIEELHRPKPKPAASPPKTEKPKPKQPKPKEKASK